MTAIEKGEGHHYTLLWLGEWILAMISLVFKPWNSPSSCPSGVSYSMGAGCEEVADVSSPDHLDLVVVERFPTVGAPSQALTHT